MSSSGRTQTTTEKVLLPGATVPVDVNVHSPKPVIMPGATDSEVEAELAERRRQVDKARKQAAKQAAENARIDAAIEKALPGRVDALVARYAKQMLEEWPRRAAEVLARAQLEDELRHGGMSMNPPPPALYPDYVRRLNDLPR